MVGKAKLKAEYGDFQTPATLARAVCACVGDCGLQPASLLEPTCGFGNLLFAGLDHFSGIEQAVGVDINAEHIQRARNTLRERQDARRIELAQADFFVTDWERVVVHFQSRSWC